MGDAKRERCMSRTGGRAVEYSPALAMKNSSSIVNGRRGERMIHVMDRWQCCLVASIRSEEFIVDSKWPTRREKDPWLETVNECQMKLQTVDSCCRPAHGGFEMGDAERERCMSRTDGSAVEY